MSLGNRLLGGLLEGLGKLLKSQKWLIFFAALGALVAGGWLLVKVWQGQPVAAAFTRVGGETHVETALEASRFWTQTPPRVITVAPEADQETMLAAAQCAMASNAPLLFRSRDLKRERAVDATIASWQMPPNRVISVSNKDSARQCLPESNLADVAGVSAYGLQPYLALPLPHPRPTRDGLAPVVVFAAVWRPRFPPDVAVGLALAAHLAKTDGDASLVVVPRYLEASPELGDQLRKQHELVKGGVILGSTAILSEDTRALLRQLLTSTNEQAVLGEIRTNLGLIAPLLAALATLFALGMEPKLGRNIEQRGNRIRTEKYRTTQARAGSPEQVTLVAKAARHLEVWMFRVRNASPNGSSASTQPTESDWLKVLGEDRDVSVWLHNGRNFTGTVDDRRRSETVLRLNGVKLEETEPQSARLLRVESEHTADVLLPFEDIELITVNVPKPSDGERSADTVGSQSDSPR